MSTVKGIRDYEFVELMEETSGIKKTENISWQMNWTGFQPSHRQAPNHPYGSPGDKPGFARFEWETIDQKRLNSHHGVMPEPKEAGRIPFEIGLYDTWPAEQTVTSTLFWDVKKKQSVGVFITDAAAWNDKDYAIWHYPGTLSIQFYFNNGLLSWFYPVAEGTRAQALGVSATLPADAAGPARTA